MVNPKVTVLMSVYNGESYLGASIDSILNQTFKDFEFIIINDGSTDMTKEILESYTDPRISIINNDKNIGLTRSLNMGLELAGSEYIARMDADDVSLPERLEKQVKFLENNPTVILLGNWIEIIDDNGNVRSITRYPTDHCFIAWVLLFKTCLAHPTVMYRRKEVLTIGAYNRELKYTQDYDLWVRLSKAGKIRQIPEVLLKVRKSKGSIEDRFQEQQVEIARDIAFHYAKSIINEIDNDIFLYFFKKTKNNDLTYHQIKKIVSFTKTIKNKFLKIHKPDRSCKNQIAKDVGTWFLVWAAKNWKHPLIFFYLIFSTVTTRLASLNSSRNLLTRKDT